jgi:hypothetical protein
MVKSSFLLYTCLSKNDFSIMFSFTLVFHWRPVLSADKLTTFLTNFLFSPFVWTTRSLQPPDFFAVKMLGLYKTWSFLLNDFLFVIPSLFRFKYSTRHFWKNFNLCSSLRLRYKDSHLYKAKGKTHGNHISPHFQRIQLLLLSRGQSAGTYASFVTCATLSVTCIPSK